MRDLQDAGWTSREKTKEERQYDLVSMILPMADRRLGKIQDSVDRLVGGTGPRPPETPPGTPRKPVNPEEAQRLARILELEEKLKAGT